MAQHIVLILRLELLVSLLLLFLLALTLLSFLFDFLYDGIADDFGVVTVSHLVRGVLTDIVEVVVLALILILLVLTLWVPTVLAFADEATIFVLYAIIAPKGGVSSTTSQTATQLRLPTRRHTSYLEHAFIACVELVAQHRLHIILERHAKVAVLQRQPRLVHRRLQLGVRGRSTVATPVLPLTVIILLRSWRDVSLQASIDTDVIWVLPLAVGHQHDVISRRLVVAVLVHLLLLH